MKKLGGIILLLLLIVSYSWVVLELRNTRNTNEITQGVQYSSLQMLPPAILSALAGEFKGIVSDIILLNIGASVGTKLIRSEVKGKYKIVKKQHDWKKIHLLFRNSLSLDPSFQQTYFLVQGYLPWDAKLTDETEELHHISATNRPWDWRPYRLIGFNSYFFHNDFRKAGRYYLKAAEVPNSPNFLPVLGARLANRGYDTKTAIDILRGMHSKTGYSKKEQVELKKRLLALEGALVIEDATKSYYARFGKVPTHPQELVREGILKELPRNPYSEDYCISRRGTVHFDDLDCAVATEK